ncbi:MFS transporter [Cyanobium sp. Morenito 9A2]|nr:MFS transporter [Cyanobium sp. Morenito 9A2]MCP9849912.1 MFS transporter [Cyanobium sp. Morenito 9A2]
MSVAHGDSEGESISKTLQEAGQPIQWGKQASTVLKKITNPLSVVFFTILLDKIGENIIFPILPFVLASYNPNALTIGLTASVSTFFGTLASPVTGALADISGRRPIILTCIALNFGALLIFGWANSLALILVSRAITGVAMSSNGALQAYIADISTISNRARNLGLIGAAFGLGSIFGPVLGGVLVGFGPKVPIFATAGLTAYNLITAVLFLKETKPQAQGQTAELRQIKLVKPVIDLLKTPVINKVAIGFSAYSFAFSAFTSLLVLALKDLFDWNSSQTSGLFVLLGLTLTVAQVWFTGKTVNKLGEYSVNRYGMIATAIALTLIPIASLIKPLSATIIVASAMLLAIGASFVQPTSRSMVSGLTPSEKQGVVLGSLASLTNLANCAGPIVAGLVYDKTPSGSFLIQAAVILLGAFLLGSNPKHESECGQT